MREDARAPATSRPLPAGRCLLLLLVPWLFLGLLGLVAWHVVLPALRHGAAHGYLLAAVFAVVGPSFAAAAVTLSRDLLTGRYP